MILAALLCGVLNAIAGGGSFLLFPALLATGMQPVQANAANTVAIWPGQLGSIAAYREGVRKHRRLAVPIGIAGLIGGTAGAVVLLMTPQTTFLHLVPWLLLVAATIFAVSGPVAKLLSRRRALPDGSGHGIRLAPVFFGTVFVCFYVGYFGAGSGFLMITLLSLFGMTDLYEINALKMVAMTMANGMAFIIFLFKANIEWRYCLPAMIVSAIGGYSSARLSRHIPPAVLRAVVVVIGFGMAAWFFWKDR